MRTALLTLTLASLTLVGCGGSSSAPTDVSTPESSILAPVKAIANADLATVVQSQMPGKTGADIEQLWLDNRADFFASETDAAEFDEMMATLTKPGAADELFEMAKPQLEEMAPMLPVVMGMMKQQLATAEQPEGVSEAEFQQMQVGLGAMLDWVSTAELTDEKKLKDAIDIAVATASKLGVKTAADVEGLSFDQAIEKGNVVLAGLMDITNVYGLDMRGVLDSVEVADVKLDGVMATVTYTMDFMGKELSFDAEREKFEGGWFDPTRVAEAKTE